ncbi:MULTISPECIES: ATP-binding protein [unclassified Agromyces]|uniref:ATP-binding protein n=1 Tax=unclassified Agromyces TaxID=2639701 RepID=UPI003014B542
MAARRQQGRVAVMAARLLAAVAVALAAVAVALPLVSGLDYLDEIAGTPEIAVAISFSVTGALLAGTKRGHRIGGLLLAIGVTSAIYAASVSWTAFVLGGDATAPLPPGSELALVTAWVTGWAWLPSWLLVSTVLPQVVPDGRPLPGRWWRVPLWATAVAGCIGILSFMVAPGPIGFFEGIDNPFAVPALAAVLEPVVGALQPGVLVLVAVSLASVVVRVVRADGIERRQVGWFGYAVALVVVVILVAPSPWANAVVLLIPVGIAVATLRYRLYDLDLLVNRTVVIALLLAGAAIAYAALVAWVGALVGTSEGIVPFVAAFAVALAFHPARIRLQRFVDRLFHGLRGDPYALLRDLDRTLREADSPREALSRAAAQVRAGLRLPGVGLVVPLPSGGEVREQSGELTEAPAVIPLELHGRQVGELLAAPRDARSTAMDAADTRVLQALAGPLASAAYALRLSGDLEDSHRRLLAAREDERRRLRRDLHDGLGPQLAGLVMGLDVVRSALSRGDADRAGELAVRTGAQARAAVEDVRRLVQGLRPPALDDLGLVGALRATGLAAAEGGPRVTIEAEGLLDGLPALVEVAAFRIATEAMTNAVRHADAGAIDVRLRATPDALEVRIQDDGSGMRPGAAPGVGLASMRERAAELGGWCAVEPSERGTLVRAHLPVTREPVPSGGEAA